METFCSEDVFVIETFCSGKVFVAEKFCRGDVFITETFCRGDYLKRRRFWNNKQWMANCSTYISCNKKDLIITLRQGRTPHLQIMVEKNWNINCSAIDKFYQQLAKDFTVANIPFIMIKFQFYPSVLQLNLSRRGSVIYFITFPYLLPGLFQRKFYTNILERTDATSYAPQSNLRQLFPEYFTESRMRSFRNISRNHRWGSGIYHGKKGGTFPLQHYNIHWRKVTKYS